MPNFNGGSTGDGTIDGPTLATLLMQNEVPAEAIDGANVDYTTAFAFVSGTLQVYLNGDLLRDGHDYNVAGDLAGFATVIPPRAGDVLLVTYIKA